MRSRRRSHLSSVWSKSGHSRVPPSPQTRTYLTLLPVQIELVLANGHSPDGLDQRWTCVPCVHRNATVPKRPPRHGSPGKARIRRVGHVMSVMKNSTDRSTSFTESPLGPTCPDMKVTDKHTHVLALGLVAKAIFLFLFNKNCIQGEQLDDLIHIYTVK